MATTPRGIVTPDSGDPYNYIVDLATMADTIDDAIGDVDVSADIPTIQNDISALQTATGVKNYRWADATERAAQTGMEEGDRGYQEDTGLDYYYDGSNWLVNLPGLNLVTPSSVAGSGATLQGRGVVVLSSVTGAVGIEGVFTSRFRNYRVLMDLTTSANVVLGLQLRQGSTNATGSVYDRQAIRGRPAGPSAVQDLGSTAWNINITTGAGVRHVASLDLFSPNQPTPTQGVATVLSTLNPMVATDNVGAGVWGCLHRTSDAYDGLNIVAPSSGSVSGTIQVYGYNE